MEMYFPHPNEAGAFKLSDDKCLQCKFKSNSMFANDNTCSETDE